MHRAIFSAPLLFLAAGLFTCSDIGLTGVETTNGKIIAVLVNSDGSPAADAAVCCIPEDFNPVQDSALRPVWKDTTDESGMCAFIVPKNTTYNLQTVLLAQRTRAIATGIVVNDRTVTVSDTLQQPGAVRIILPNEIDARNGFVYITGTTLYRNFKSNIRIDAQNRKYVTLDSVPVSPSLRLAYGERAAASSQNLSNAVAVQSGRVTEIVVNNFTLKPVWNFRILAGVTAQTLQYYGNSLDSLKKLMADQMAHINCNFNDSGYFSGFSNFSVDSVYVFTTSPITNEFAKPPAGYAFRLIYNAYGNAGDGGYYADRLTCYHVENVATGGTIFGDISADQLTWNFGQARGGVSLSIMGVYASENPVNGQVYIVEESMMNNARATKRWDSLHINIFNHYKDTIGFSRSIYQDAFPSDIGLVVQSGTGSPLPNVKINLYRVEWGQYKVFTPIQITGSTDGSGTLVFNGNPFKPDTFSTIQYPNFLVQAINGSDTVYSWFPFTEISNTWFKNSSAPFRKKIVF